MNSAKILFVLGITPEDRSEEFDAHRPASRESRSAPGSSGALTAHSRPVLGLAPATPVTVSASDPAVPDPGPDGAAQGDGADTVEPTGHEQRARRVEPIIPDPAPAIRDAAPEPAEPIVAQPGGASGASMIIMDLDAARDPLRGPTPRVRDVLAIGAAAVVALVLLAVVALPLLLGFLLLGLLVKVGGSLRRRVGGPSGSAGTRGGGPSAGQGRRNVRVRPRD